MPCMWCLSRKQHSWSKNKQRERKSTSVQNFIEFYIAACLHRTTPKFISTAELLGMTVENTGALRSVWVLCHVVWCFGSDRSVPFVGVVAAVVGVDAVRGSIEAARQAQSTGTRRGRDSTHQMGAFFRGIFLCAVEATHPTRKITKGWEQRRITKSSVYSTLLLLSRHKHIYTPYTYMWLGIKEREREKKKEKEYRTNCADDTIRGSSMI